MLGVAVMITVLAGWTARESMAELNALTDVRARMRTSRLQLEHLLSLFKDIETGSRGFLLTGHRDYLAPYEAAKQEIPGVRDGLRSRVDGALADDLRAADALIERRLLLSDAVVSLRENAGESARGNLALINEGKQAMDAIRAAFARMDEKLDRRIDALSAQALETRRREELLSWLSSMVTLALVLLGSAYILHERHLRGRLELQLREANHDLEGRVAERTSALEDARDRLSRFAAGQEQAIEDERRRIAREVHDQIGQVFSAIKLMTTAAPGTSFAEGQKHAVLEALDLGIDSTRRITAELRPPLLDDLGLPAALKHYADRIARPASLAIEVDVRDHQAIGKARALALFRIAQEALTNVVRHAGASTVAIRGERDGDRYRFVVADNGKGLPAEATRPGALGLVGMCERAAMLGGRCEFDSLAGAGLAVTVDFPIETEAP